MQSIPGSNATEAAHVALHTTTPATKPVPLQVQPDAIPATLRDIPTWVVWRYQRRGNGWTKPPFQTSGMLAKSNDAATWTTFDEALAAYQTGRFDGIGWNVRGDVVGIDLDDVIGADGDIDPRASAILDRFAGTYCELSPSGSGYRIFAIGQFPVAGKKIGDWLEVYREGSPRYLTLTGHAIAAADVTAQQAALDWLYQTYILKQPDLTDDDNYGRPPPDEYMGDALACRCPSCGLPAEYPDCENCGYRFDEEPDTEAKPAANSLPPVSVRSDDRLALALRNTSIAALYAGSIEGYPSRSEAVLGLALKMMTFADGDTAQVAAWLDGSNCERWHSDGPANRERVLTLAASRWDGQRFEPRNGDAEHGAAILAALMKNRTAQTAPQTQGGRAAQTGTKRLFIPVEQFIGNPAPPSWTVKRYLPAASLCVIFGESTAGKSFLAIDWACCIATGKAWNGQPVKQGTVVYIAGEGHHGLKRRFAAWQSVNGAIPPDTLHINKTALVLTPEGAAAVAGDIGAIPGIPALIVVDTLATLMDGDENSGSDMSKFLNYLKKLIEGTGATLVVVHHTGHGDKTRGRGHSSLKCALDVEYRLERTDGIGTLTCTKPKDFDPPRPLAYELQIVELPDAYHDPDEPDEPVTSCVFAVTGEPTDTGRGKARKLPAGQAIALRALQAALTDHGGTYSGQFGVHIEDWRKAAYRDGIAEGEAHAKKVAFQRARQALLASGHVRCADDIYWLADPGQQSAAALLNTQKRKTRETEE